ncbi:MAG: YkoF family thiamine/hydroxymethylpyrimidine-binding protein [Pseudomonadales bacterium]|nr:YkoF family thiamine/hydroxymethylpyrimidine-binding protein [Pseudomonadales bacterium]MDG1304237.1 YkoF family thiamine/hydroxymethylpyrimidine-binding protein [Pseudomonadales bacterium]MDG1833908.1 YkoF family thiamine/hydroxymethylpyrimidine-binding protein [Pseudomonadales bacterium]MDG1908608.1 YkoF family thiamine/hydroxymethylpyrimidine-binding protein [Pseudomonadales bacterium]
MATLLQASVDISLYPLKEEYIPAIAEFIDRIGRYPRIHVTRNDLSTQLFGEYDEIMEILKKEIRFSWEKWGKGIFVIKFLLDDLRGLADS